MYTILTRGGQESERAELCALAIMAKAPRAGEVKTRLQPPLTANEAAALNERFLRDTAANIASVADAGGALGLVCYTPVGEEETFDDLLPDQFALIAQRGDGFGERLLYAAEDILSCGFGAVCLIDSDSPTLPTAALQDAVRELKRPGDRAVIGPSVDGGYYLIGVKHAEPRIFEGVAWSTDRVYAETVERVREVGMELVELPKWYDVDDARTLAILERELIHGELPPFATLHGFNAEWTREMLAERVRDRMETKERW